MEFNYGVSSENSSLHLGRGASVSSQEFSFSNSVLDVSFGNPGDGNSVISAECITLTNSTIHINLLSNQRSGNFSFFLFNSTSNCFLKDNFITLEFSSQCTISESAFYGQAINFVVNCDSKGYELSKILAISLGIGIPLLAAVVIGVGWYMRQKKVEHIESKLKGQKASSQKIQKNIKNSSICTLAKFNVKLQF